MAERGTHAQLMARRGLYYELVSTVRWAEPQTREVWGGGGGGGRGVIFDSNIKNLTIWRKLTEDEEWFGV